MSEVIEYESDLIRDWTIVRIWEMVQGRKPTTMYLAQHALAHLAGNLNPDKQAEWLDAHGWKYKRDEDGMVLVYSLEAGRKMQEQKERLATEAIERGDGIGARIFGVDGRPIQASVYLVGAVGLETPIKVGYAISPEQRLVDLQIGSPMKLRLLAKYRAADRSIAREAENKIHHQFKDRRLHGEWFDVHLWEIVDWIDSTFASVLTAELRQ